MKRVSSGPIYTTVFVDYDNVYLSLKRKNEDAAKRFAKDSGVWLQALISGELITPTSVYAAPVERRIAMTRCYGNSTPRRNSHDNSTDMNSFPFIKHHFLRAGFEIIDCPPMTQQMKNAADIRMVLDIGDILAHDTFFHEVVILSGDADFTPLLHRLRAHARRSVVFANDSTAQPYTALSDGEVRESNLISLLLDGRAVTADPQPRGLAAPAPALVDLEEARRAILSEVVGFVRGAPQAVPLETLADRAVRIVGRDKTIGTEWGGYGSFQKLLLSGLPDDLHLSDTAPYTVFDANRHITATGLIAPGLPQSQELPAPGARSSSGDPAANRAYRPAATPTPQQSPLRTDDLAPRQHAPVPNPGPSYAPAPSPYAPQAPAAREPQREPQREPPRAQQPAPPQPRTADQATQIQQSISRIHNASQAPAFAPAEYRVLFDVMAQEITASGLQGAQTLINIGQRAREFGLDAKRDDLRFVLDVVSESDPWFEQGASASLFASRFRNFVVARCRSQGISLSADELDLIEAWFSAQPAAPRTPAYGRTAPPPAASRPASQAPGSAVPQESDRWFAPQSDYGARDPEPPSDDEFPRIVRTRLRG